MSPATDLREPLATNLPAHIPRLGMTTPRIGTEPTPVHLVAALEPRIRRPA
ncbi:MULTISPECIES: hypothetical protein [Amycolatopsis]|uniref:Uncharacterized protein n=1 Tax=Amycolatopsis thermalba TaxID=944492 RepID=A0ABY4NT98_9PSEU|nr:MULTISPECIES: hypothetical protein [Amycolatopsis]UQS23280.1 hypothetical protein L1857_10850 [Amycolatopsis thermalba]